MRLESLALPDEMVWVDEFSWCPVSAKLQRTLGGVLVYEHSAVSGNSGRPMTLESESAWMDRDDLESLFAMSFEPGQKYTLMLNNLTTYQVWFRLWDQPAVEATPIIAYAFPTASSIYKIRLKFTIAE